MSFDHENYSRVRPLGKGGQGNVTLWIRKTFSDQGQGQLPYQVAVKTIIIKPGKEKERWRQEIKLLTKLHHPNIIQAYGHDITEEVVKIFMPLCHTSLQNFVPYDGCTLDQVIFLARQCLDGFVFLHSKGIAHRDIKPDNLLINMSAHEAPVVKIADFGYAKAFQDLDFSDSAPGTVVGTPFYVAPELIAKQQRHQKIDENDWKPADVYSMGVVIKFMDSFWPLSGNLKHPQLQDIHHRMTHHNAQQERPTMKESLDCLLSLSLDASEPLVQDQVEEDHRRDSTPTEVINVGHFVSCIASNDLILVCGLQVSNTSFPLKVFGLAKLKGEQLYNHHKGWINHISIREESVLVGSSDGTISWWLIDSSSCSIRLLQTLAMVPNQVTFVDTAMNYIVALGYRAKETEKGEIHVWHRQGKIIKPVHSTPDRITTACLVPAQAMYNNLRQTLRFQVTCQDGQHLDLMVGKDDFRGQTFGVRLEERTQLPQTHGNCIKICVKNHQRLCFYEDGFVTGLTGDKQVDISGSLTNVIDTDTNYYCRSSNGSIIELSQNLDKIRSLFTGGPGPATGKPKTWLRISLAGDRLFSVNEDNVSQLVMIKL